MPGGELAFNGSHICYKVMTGQRLLTRLLIGETSVVK
jgi:hypothetical protein